MAKDDTSFWARGPGLLLIGLLTVTLGAAGGAAVLLHSVTHPPRDRNALDPADVQVRAEEVTFQASDGVPLSGWFMAGRPRGSVILLCHDLGAARSAMLNTAVALSRNGYPLFLFDFRGHGLSGGKGSSLGIDERLDVLGAVAYLKTRRDIDSSRFGAWGIGMGAYAAALASLEDRTIVALALDSLYPEVGSQLDRLVRARIPPALHSLLPAVRLAYDPYFSFKLKRYTVTASLNDLAARNLLFIAGADIPERLHEQKALYASLPDSPAADKNLLELSASGVSGLYAGDKKKYDAALIAFFQTYLGAAARPAGKPQRPIQVIER